MAERTRLFGKRAAEAEEAIARAEALLDVLRLSKVNLSAAIHLVAESRAAWGRKDLDSALRLAARAERLASTLEGRYRGAQNALNALRAISDKARQLGVQAREFDDALVAARRVAREGTVEDGITIPNYLQARTILDAALARGSDLLRRAEAAANQIFTAELALDALKDANGTVDHAEFERLVLGGGRALIERAKQALANGNLDEADVAGRRAEEGAKKTLLAYQDAIGALSATERTISDLRSEGALAVAADRLLEQGQLLLHHGKIAEARDILEKAAQESHRVAIDSRRAAKSVAEAEESLSALTRAGFFTDEGNRAIRDAKRALAEGRYDRAEELAAEARRALGKRQEVRDRLARTIEETKRKVVELRAVGTDYANDVEEMVLRAEREFENGDFATSSEDLKIATLLMGPPSNRTPHGKGRPA